jgi:CMP-2-keto-3-deoxyoctulosonic acid synthetase
MNRVLENGGGIRMVFSPSRTIGVDVQADLDVAEGLMKSDKYFKEYCST